VTIDGATMSSDSTYTSLRERQELANDTTDQDSSVLSKLRPSRLASGVASLIQADETDPEPQAFARSSTDIYSTTLDIDRPDPETEDYWVEYRNNPIISAQIDQVPKEVFEAGYWVEADSSETEDEISEYLENIGIEAGRPHRTFKELGEQAIVQYLVRGTFLGEQVTEDGRHVAINPVNPTTVEMYTKAGVNILVPPDYTPGHSDSLIKRTDEGDIGAYVQFDEQFSRWQDRTERRFTRNEMLHWARNPDIGDLRGQSAVKPVFERSRAMREKLQDNDLAIAMKAWPMILFQMGTPERPWTKEDMEDFMDDYEKERLGPGMFQGVPGDIEVHEFAGETADIQEHVQTDVDLIVSGMPGPKYALGSFTDGDENEAVAGAHERQFRKLIRTLRQDLEKLFTPYLKDVAESWGYDPSGLELNIGRPDGEVAPEDIQGNIIRYQSDVADDDGAIPGETVDGETVIPSSSGTTDKDIEDERQEATNESAQSAGEREPIQRTPTPAVERLAAPDTTVPVNDEPEALADPRLVSTSDIERDLGETVGTILVEARDETLDILDRRYGDQSIPYGWTVGSEFERQVRTARRDHDLASETARVCDAVLGQTLETLDQHTHSPNISGTPRAQHRDLVSATNESVVADCQDLASEIASEFRQQVDLIHGSDRGIDAVRERVRDVYDDGTLSFRGQLLARMNVQELINRVKLTEYRASDAVVGVEIISRCGADTHRLTDDLAACDGGTPARARFDSDEPIGAQFQADASVEPPQGFDPLPDVPPFHFGDRAELAPITEADLEN